MMNTEKNVEQATKTVKSRHPFARLLGLRTLERGTGDQAGRAKMTLMLREEHMNPQHIAHGAVAYALADTCMGSALFPMLAPGLACSTIEIKITYFRPAIEGDIICEAWVVNKGRTIANIDAKLWMATAPEKLIASANGNFAIFPYKAPER